MLATEAVCCFAKVGREECCSISVPCLDEAEDTFTLVDKLLVEVVDTEETPADFTLGERFVDGESHISIFGDSDGACFVGIDFNTSDTGELIDRLPSLDCNRVVMGPEPEVVLHPPQVA
ncbi:hypothetical protein HG530_007152 [Fusarium avenaceum]|nr:hypothetical protein HG530_007152 [Fusarium avenaceum]